MPSLVAGERVSNNYGRSVPYFGQDLYCVTAVVTLAQLNAGFAFLAAAPDVTYEVVDFDVIPLVTFTTATDIRISDTAAAPVDIATFAIANVTNGNVLAPGATGVTLGAGFGVQATANKGLQIRKTGSNAAGGTSLLVLVRYKVNNA